MELVETLVLMVLCVGLASICLCRAVMMDQRTLLLPRLALVGLFMCSAAGIIAPVVHWDTDWICIGLVASVLSLMYASRDMWKDGVPSVFLKLSERFPQKDRRDGADRRAGQPLPPA